jgi:hypothetical protein
MESIRLLCVCMCVIFAVCVLIAILLSPFWCGVVAIKNTSSLISLKAKKNIVMYYLTVWDSFWYFILFSFWTRIIIIDIYVQQSDISIRYLLWIRCKFIFPSYVELCIVQLQWEITLPSISYSDCTVDERVPCINLQVKQRQTTVICT